MKSSEQRIERQNRANDVIATLKKHYPLSKVALNFDSPLELLIAVILSAQSTDVMVNKVTETLFKKYTTLDEYVKADPEEFAQHIKRTGFYHAKAKNILKTVSMIKEKFHGQVPKTMEELLTLAGVARKTANVVLGNGFNIVVGIAVDTHVSRLSQRLRLVDMDAIGGGKKTFTFQKGGKTIVDFKKDADPVRIERELMDVIPKAAWFKTTYLLVDHGRAICTSQRPDCAHCVLNTICPSSRV